MEYQRRVCNHLGREGEISINNKLRRLKGGVKRVMNRRNTLLFIILLSVFAFCLCLCSCFDDLLFNSSETEKHEHILEMRSKTYPTCNGDGNEKYYQCKDCSKMFLDGNAKNEIGSIPIIAKTNKHSFSDNTCSVCGIKQYTVRFKSSGGVTILKKVVSGECVEKPDDPPSDNKDFKGWCYDKEGNNLFDFSSPILQNLTLYPSFELDAVAITNKITTETIKSVVKIYNKSYNTFLGITTDSKAAQGSGVVFEIDSEGWCYVLTNCHVVKKESGYDKQKITVYDYRGKEYQAEMHKGRGKSFEAIDRSYDLAVIKFKCTNENVKAVSLASSNPMEYEDVIALGNPGGQNNAIAFGKVAYYTPVKVTDVPVTFDVLLHDAYTEGGSSGGPLLDSSLELVGIHFAGVKAGNNGERTHGAAIPIDKVREFLNKYFY